MCPARGKTPASLGWCLFLATWSYLYTQERILKKIGSTWKLVKAGILHRSYSNSSARGLTADGCRLLALLKLEKSLWVRAGGISNISVGKHTEANFGKKCRWNFQLTKKLRKIFTLKMKTWDTRLIPRPQFLPFLHSPMTLLSNLRAKETSVPLRADAAGGWCRCYYRLSASSRAYSQLHRVSFPLMNWEYLCHED